jgi:hypothetical protein
MREIPVRRSEPGCTREVTPPSECDRWMPPRFKMLELRGSSLSFRPLQRSQNGEATIHTPDLPKSDYGPPAGFPTPLTV